MKNTILLAPNAALASQIEAAATVEAEYGTTVIEGSKITLAHHTGKYAGMLAPCIVEEITPLENGEIILISHINGDTIGGCLALMGCKPESKEFWDAIAYYDVHGAHHIHELPQMQQDMLYAYLAWNATLPRTRYTDVTDVTEVIMGALPMLTNIIQKDDTVISVGKEWKLKTEQAVEDCLVFETDKVRGFRTDSVFCSASYYSPSQKKVIPATVSLNTKTRAITIAFEDGGKKISAVRVVQALWGKDAGGHAGIAGSPRNWNLSDEELEKKFKNACTIVNLY